jgi:hypothetical protein
VHNPQNAAATNAITQLPFVIKLSVKTPFITAHAKLTFLDAKNFIFSPLDGGDGGSRTRVHNKSNYSRSQVWSVSITY